MKGPSCWLTCFFLLVWTTNAQASAPTGQSHTTAPQSKKPISTPVYPPTSPTVPQTIAVSSRISSENDDAEENPRNGGMTMASGELDLGQGVVGLRFQKVQVPQGSRITAAYIDFTVHRSKSQRTILAFRVEASDDAPPFANTPQDISKRPLTSSTVNWNKVPVWNDGPQQSPNLSTIVQDIVNRPGWSLGNSMAFVIYGDGKRSAASYKRGTKKAPLLRVEYETPYTDPPTDAQSITPVKPTTPPTVAQTMISSISSENDDAEENPRDGGMTMASMELDLGQDVVGLRFQAVQVPQGSRITAAHIDFTAYISKSQRTTLVFRVEASDNATPIANAPHDISKRPLASSTVNWNKVPKWNDGPQQSPNLRAIVQDIVNRPGWSSGNSMVFVIYGTGKRSAASYRMGTTKAPLLRVEYETPYTEPPTGPPTIRPSYTTATPTDPPTNDPDCEGYKTDKGCLKADPVPLGQEGRWELIFSDEFDGSGIEKSKWDTAWFSSSGYTKPDNDMDIVCYHPSQVHVGGGNLQLKGEIHSHPDCLKLDGSPADYVSGLVNTRSSFNFTHGYVEARILLPGTDGMDLAWPAFWSTGYDWPTTGEIDIMEGLSSGQPCFSYHWGTPENQESFTKCANTSNRGAWHTYGVLWEEGKITAFYDGAKLLSHTRGIVSNPHYLVLNYGMRKRQTQTLDGNLDGTSVPSAMVIDYVRVWSPHSREA